MLFRNFAFITTLLQLHMLGLLCQLFRDSFHNENNNDVCVVDVSALKVKVGARLAMETDAHNASDGRDDSLLHMSPKD